MTASRISRSAAGFIGLVFVAAFLYHCYGLLGRSGAGASSFNSVDFWLLKNVVGPVARAVGLFPVH